MMTASERQRRYRKRCREGCRKGTIDVDPVVEDALIVAGLLAPEDGDDRRKADAALSMVVRTWAEEKLAAVLVEEVTRNAVPFDFGP